MGWFLRLMEELAIECRVGHPTAIRKAETRRQKHDRRDAEHCCCGCWRRYRFPAIWMPSTGAPGSPVVTPAPPSVGPHADARAERAAGDRAGPRRAARPHVVESRRPGAACLVATAAAHGGSSQRASSVVSAFAGSPSIDSTNGCSTLAKERARATLLMTHPGVEPVTALATEVFVGDPARFLDGKASRATSA